MNKYAIAITIAKMEGDKVDASRIQSLLYVIDASSKENAIGTAMSFHQVKNSFELGYVICHVNTADIK